MKSEVINFPGKIFRGETMKLTFEFETVQDMQAILDLADEYDSSGEAVAPFATTSDWSGWEVNNE